MNFNGLECSSRIALLQMKPAQKLICFLRRNYIASNYTYETHEWNNDGRKCDEHKYINSVFLGLLNFGYGIEVQLYKGLFIKQSVGLEIYYSTSEFDELTPDTSGLSNEDIKRKLISEFGIYLWSKI